MNLDLDPNEWYSIRKETGIFVPGGLSKLLFFIATAALFYWLSGVLWTLARAILV